MLLDPPDRVVQGVPGAGEHHRRPLDRAAHDVAGDDLPLVVQPLAVLRLLAALHAVVQIQHVRRLGEADLARVDRPAHDAWKAGPGAQIDRLAVRVRPHQPGLREDVVVQILVRGRQIFQTAVVEALDEVIARPLHQGRAVRGPAGEHVDEIDPHLALARALRHRDRQQLEFPVQDVLEPLHHRAQIVPPRGVEPLLRLPVQLDVRHEGVEVVRGLEEQTPPPLVVPRLGVPPRLGLHLFRAPGQQALVLRVGRGGGLLRPAPAQREQVLIRRPIPRRPFDRRPDRRGQLLMIHPRLTSSRKRGTTRASPHRWPLGRRPHPT